MQNSVAIENGNRLCVASYPSWTVSNIISDFYCSHTDIERLDFREGEMQDIIDFVYTGVSEIGILYVSTNKQAEFEHILEHKHLEFIPITNRNLCIYVGDKHQLYKDQNKKSLTEKQISDFKYIRGIRDFFAVEHHVEYTNLTPSSLTGFQDKVVTNSDHLTVLLMEKTDLCWMGIDTVVSNDDAKCTIESKANTLVLGYIKRMSTALSPITKDFLDCLIKEV